jgi:HPt (histidine-containing phosphotransfer) domain-containing protein
MSLPVRQSPAQAPAKRRSALQPRVAELVLTRAESTEAKLPVDLSRLRRFTLDNVELELEIIGLFAVQAPIMMDALVRARTEADWRDATHTLKGSSASIGAWMVAEAAARSESLTKQPAEWAAALRDMASAMHTSLAYLAQVQASHGPSQCAVAVAE